MRHKYFWLCGCFVLILCVGQIFYWTLVQCLDPMCASYLTPSIPISLSSWNANKDYIVHTPLCKIWNINPFNKFALQDRLSQVNKNRKSVKYCSRNSQPQLVVYKQMMLKINFENDTIFENCCYRQIYGGEYESHEGLNALSDGLVRTSNTCLPIPAKGVEMKSPFVRFECTAQIDEKSNSLERLHVDFAATVFPPVKNTFQTKAKAIYWDEFRKKSQKFPLNIFILELNSVSRLNMQRSFPKARNFALKNDFIEFNGFTTMHGSNVIGNMLTVMSGSTGDNYPCWNGKIPENLDKCPFIWEKFHKRNYITAIVDDAHGLPIFNYNKLDLAKQPVDYSLSTLMGAVESYYKSTQSLLPLAKCINGRDSVDTMVKYMQDFLKNVGGAYPYFLVSRFGSSETETRQHHRNQTGPTFSGVHIEDKKIRKILEFVLKGGRTEIGNNTIVILYSPNGKVFSKKQNESVKSGRASLPTLKLSSTYESLYEEALPSLYVRLPPSLKKQYPDWYANLKVNSDRLTSTLDLHATLENVLNLSRPLTPLNLINHPESKGNRSDVIRIAYSLFEEIPLNRTCELAEIPDRYCMCKPYNDLFESSNRYWRYRRTWNSTGQAYRMFSSLPKFRQWVVKNTPALIKRDFKQYKFLRDNNRNIDKYTLAKGGQPIQTVIFANWRSDSTFLGEILASHPGVFFYNEPLAHFGFTQPSTAAAGVQVLHNLLNCNYSDLDAYLETWKSKSWFYGAGSSFGSFCRQNPIVCFDLKFLSSMCKLFPFQVIKTVRIRLKYARPLLEDPKLNVKIIHLVRDPRATMQSRFQQDWCQNDSFCNSVDVLCSDLVDNFYETQKLRVEFPNRILVIRYEDMAKNIYSAAKKIFKFSRLEYHHRTKSFLDNHTKSKRKKRSYSNTTKKTKSSAFDWIQDMSSNFTMVQRIQNSCGKAMELWGYRLSRNLQAFTEPHFDPVLKPSRSGVDTFSSNNRVNNYYRNSSIYFSNFSP